jgi:hypothetical protein
MIDEENNFLVMKENFIKCNMYKKNNMVLLVFAYIVIQ